MSNGKENTYFSSDINDRERACFEIGIKLGALYHILCGIPISSNPRIVDSIEKGIEASIFFTFFGLYAILKKFQDEIKIATVGNPAMRVPDAKGMLLPTWMGAMPGMSSFATKMMNKEMEALDIPPVGEFIEMISDAGGKLYACKATVDMFHLTEDDFCPQVEKVLTVGEFYELSAGAQIIFT